MADTGVTQLTLVPVACKGTHYAPGVVVVRKDTQL